MRCGNCGTKISGRPVYCPQCAVRIAYRSNSDSCYDTPARKTQQSKHQTAKSGLGVAIFLLCWFIAIIFFGLLGSLYYDVEDEATVEIYSFTMLICAPALAAICTNMITKKLGKTILTNPKTNLPIFQKDRIAAVEKMVNEASVHYDLAVESDSVYLFLLFWKNMEEDLAGITPYYGKVPSSCTMNAHALASRIRNKQWKLRDVIERAKETAIADIKGEHRNNKRGRFNDFQEDINSHQDSYDEETSAFAQAAVEEVARAAGIGCIGAEQHQSNANVRFIGHDIDYMEGHAFEYWCADLLAKIGYTDVSVTPGSGDQGVDVLAQKDGIKYAIQCKCYSSDLGNTPVQEVLAGKKFYHCHVGAVMTNRHFTKGAKELAAETGILLWDRDWINDYLETAESEDRSLTIHNCLAGADMASKLSFNYNDEMLPAAVDVILETGEASVSMLQRRLNLGYARAARIVDEMEEKGIVGPFQGSKPRAILVTKEQWEAMK